LVTIRDYDEGFLRTLLGEEVEIELDGEKTLAFGFPVPGVKGPDAFKGQVPLCFGEPEDVYQQSYLPMIVVKRTAFTPAMDRWMSYGEEYRVPADDAQSIALTMPDGTTVHGWDRWEFKEFAYPFDMLYTVEIRSKRRGPAERIFEKVSRYLRPNFQVFLFDSESEERGYNTFVEGINMLDELSDVADRLVGYSYSIRVEGELDMRDPIVQDVLTSLPQFRFHRGG
jgi:hypothetical protein